MKKCLTSLLFTVLLLIINTKMTLLKINSQSKTLQPPGSQTTVPTTRQTITTTTNSTNSPPVQSNYGLNSNEEDNYSTINGPCNPKLCKGPNAYCVSANQCL